MIQLHRGDCLAEMGKIAAGLVDLILCDLPYGTTQNKWDAVIPFEPLWKEYRRVIKPGGAVVLTASQPFTSRLISSNPSWFRYDWIWDKSNPSGHLNAKVMPLRRHEEILIFAPARITYNPQMRTGRLRKKGGSKVKAAGEHCYGQYNSTVSFNDQYYPTSILDITNANRSEKVHPTQKPVALMEYLIRTYTHPGQLVLDNCMGSGTTGVAAVQTGRSFIGIELDDKYFQIAEQRITATQPQPTTDQGQPTNA